MRIQLVQINYKGALSEDLVLEVLLKGFEKEPAGRQWIAGRWSKGFGGIL